MKITQADVDAVHRFYKAFAARDFATVESCLAPDARWHLPGKSAVAGTHKGWAAIRDDFLARLGPLSGGTFRVELLDIAVGEQFVVAIQRATAALAGKNLDITGCQLMTVRDGKIVEVRGRYSDQYALDAFWQER